MKIRVKLDESKIVNRYLIFQTYSHRTTTSNTPQPVSSNITNVSNNTFLSSTFSSPILNFELPKIDTSGC